MDVGLEVSNLADAYSTFMAYCNPGGFGDLRAIDYEPKFDEIDGFFVLDSNTRLIYNQDPNQGTSSYTLSDAYMKYCYNAGASVQQSAFATNVPVNTLFRGKLQTQASAESDSYSPLDSSLLRLSVLSGQIRYTRMHKPSSEQDIVDRHMTVTLDHSTLSSPFSMPDLYRPSAISFVSPQTKKHSMSTYSSWIYMKDPVRHQFSKVNPLDHLRATSRSPYHIHKSKPQHINSTNLKRNAENTEAKTSAPTGHVEPYNGDISLRFNLDQPYTYLPVDIYNAYLHAKNVIVDIPDEHWESICFKLFSNKTSIPTKKKASTKTDASSSFNHFCLSGSGVIKQAFLPQQKNGHVSYFPIPGIESQSAMESYSQLITIKNTIQGGRIFGNTMVERSARALKKTMFAKSRPNSMTTYADDSYFKNSRIQSHTHRKQTLSSEFVKKSQPKTTTTMTKGTRKNITDSALYSDPIIAQYMSMWAESFHTDTIVNNIKHMSKSSETHGRHARQKRSATPTNTEPSVDFAIPVKITDVYSQEQMENMNRLTLLPHMGNANVAYIGSTFIYRNTPGVQIIQDHSSKNMYIYASQPVAFEIPFLTPNQDINEADFIFYMVINGIYVLVFIDFLFGLKALVSHQLFFNLFYIKSDYQEGVHQSKYYYKIMEGMKHVYLLNNTKRKIFISDLIWYFMESTVFTFLFLVFGWNGIVAIADGFSNVIDALTNAEYTTSIQNVQLTFTITSSFMLTNIVLTLASLVYVYLVEYTHGLFKHVKKVISGLNREIRFDKTFKKEENAAQLTTQLLADPNSAIHNQQYTSSAPINDSSIRESVTDFIESQTTNYEIIPYVITLYTSIIYITSIVYVICLSSMTSFILRLWNVLGFVLVLYLSTYALLFMTTLSRIIFETRSITKIQEKDERKDRSIIKLKRVIGVHFFILLSIWILTIIALGGFVLPYELDSYQADYSRYPINYIVSFTCVIVLIMVTVEVWESGWKSTESFRFAFAAYKTVNQYTTLKLK
jgi:hypothetical protein